MKKTITLLCVIIGFYATAQESREKDSTYKETVVSYRPFNITGISNQINVNPAYTGFEERCITNLYGEWDKPMFDITPGFYLPVSFGGSFNAALGKKKRNGVGFYETTSYYGVNNYFDIGVTYSYNFRIKQYHNLRMGLGLYYKESIIDFSELTYPDQLDIRHGYIYHTSEIPPKSNADYNAGLNIGAFYSYKDFYAGLSVNRLIDFENSFKLKPVCKPQFNLYTGYNFRIGNHAVLPSLTMQFETKYYYISPAIYYSYKNILVAGLNVKNIISPGVIAGVNILKTIFIYASCNAYVDKDRYDAFGAIESVALNIKVSLGKTETINQ